MKLKEFGPTGVRVPGAPLDPPMIPYGVSVRIFNSTCILFGPPFRNSRHLDVMVHTTLHGTGTGKDGFLYYVFTVHSTQGQKQGKGLGTNRFHTHFPGPGPVQCV